MTPDLLEQALRAYCRRRPFRAFSIELNSGGELLVSHPEAVRREGEFFVGRTAKGAYQLISAINVSRLIEVSKAKPG